MPPASPRPALGAVVLGGYLGAGKTTLVNHLLRHAQGRRIAVLVNDFGEIGIDAQLIESRDGDVLNLAGGCVCCSVGSDLVGALIELPRRVPAPDVVLIETSGVALPGSVARSARLADGIEVEGVVVLADAETIRQRATDRYVGDTVMQQLRDADLLVINKTDLVGAEALAELRAWLAATAPRARVLEAVDAEVPAELVLGVRIDDLPPHALQRSGGGLFAGDPGARRAMRRQPAASRTYASRSVRLPGPIDASALARDLTDPAIGLVRAKAIVTDRDGSRKVVQVVGPRATVTPLRAAQPGVPGAPADEGAGSLVCIAVRAQFDEAALLRCLGAHGA